MAKQDAELPLSDKHFLAPYSYATLPMNKTDPSGHAIYLVDVFGTDDDYRKVITLVTGAVERPGQVRAATSRRSRGSLRCSREGPLSYINTCPSIPMDMKGVI